MEDKFEKGDEMALRIRQERLRRGWTLAQTAKMVGITKSAYGNLETGVRVPSYVVLVKLEDLFGLSHRQLFGAVTPAIGETPGGNRANQKTKQN